MRALVSSRSLRWYSAACLSGAIDGSGGGGVAGAATAHGSVSSPFSRSYALTRVRRPFEVVQALCDGAHITSKLGARRIYRDSKAGRARSLGSRDPRPGAARLTVIVEIRIEPLACSSPGPGRQSGSRIALAVVAPAPVRIRAGPTRVRAPVRKPTKADRLIVCHAYYISSESAR